MTYNKDMDPKLWRVEREAMIESIKHWRELANHEKQQHAKWMKLYFEMKAKYDLEANNGTKGNS